MSYSGLFELRTPRDLLAKLRHDLARMDSNWLDQYAAFDFFITAHHMVDWLYPGDSNKQRRRDEVQASALLQVCSHLANGSKHFQTTDSRHTSVADTQLHEGPFSQQFSEQFDISRLEVHLTGEAANRLGSVINVLPLARQLLAFWEAYPALAPSTDAISPNRGE